MGNTLRKHKQKIKEKLRKINQKSCSGCPQKEYLWHEEEDIIGSGENSVVYRGQGSDKQFYAIKRVDPFSLTHSTLSRLNQEAAMLTEVSQIEEYSQRFIKLQEGYMDKQGGLCLVMELITGCELLEIIEKSPAGLSEQTAKTLMKQILEAMAALHAKDIAHLDLKLENIMFDYNTNEIKIIDFGFACRTSKYNRITQEIQQICLREFRGSPHYVAPQLVMSRPFNGKKADIWSLGVLCYIFLTGRFPFNGHDYNDIFHSIISDTPRLPNDISDEASSFISSMLSRNEGLRPDCNKLLSHPWLQDATSVLSL